MLCFEKLPENGGKKIKNRDNPTNIKRIIILFLKVLSRHLLL